MFNKISLMAGALAATAPFASEPRAVRRHESKHGRQKVDTAWAGHGRCRIFDNSSLRKLMRAQRRGAVPSERIRVAIEAQKSAIARAPEYMSGHARRAAGINAIHDPKTGLRVGWYVPQLTEPRAAPRMSKVYAIKSNAARAAKAYGLGRKDLLAVEGGWVFNAYGPAVGALDAAVRA